MTFQQELERLINRHSLEHGCGNTPDFLLTKYITDCLQAYTRAVRARDEWYGVELRPGLPDVIQRSGSTVNGDSNG